MARTIQTMALAGWLVLGFVNLATAQTVCLPLPRLLTTMPMGGTVGSSVEITITGENIDNVTELSFSDPRITAVPKRDAAGQLESSKFVVSIASDCPEGLYEARVSTRLGISSSRAFSVGSLPEVTQTSPNTSLATAKELKVGSVCNSVMSVRSIDFYSFEATKGQRIVVDCASRGIDSKLEAVLIIANSAGNDLLVERRSGLLDFTVPADGKYIIKVHELTYGGGPAFYYRLALRELPVGAPIVRAPSTRTVNSFSWPPTGLPAEAALAEVEPNNDRSKAQKITLPCDISGSFYPAADVDIFEFEAKKGDVWWVEIASERFGLPTDPAAVVQHVSGTGDDEKLTDVVELNDIPSPVKVSSNGYSYDGPPYNAGSSDFMGKLVIQEDGIHRLQLSDLFGGTRNEARNIYRLVIRKAAPEFALVAWGLHMELRNGDRNALSKPLALRGGITQALEVVAVRRDGFDDDIELEMSGLPEGVSATGLKIPAGSSRGMMLVTAHPNASRSIVSANFFGKATIDGQVVTRPCRLASMAWPVPEAWSEIPSPRLLADVPVSVSGFEVAPITLAPATMEVFEAVAGEKLTVPFAKTCRTEFSGDKLELKVFGTGFEKVPTNTISLTADATQAVIDLGALKTKPGEYTIAFYGSAVAKYRKNVEAIGAAEEALKKAEAEQKAIDAEASKLADDAKSAAVEQKAEADKAVQAIAERQKAAASAVAAATERLKKANEAAAPRDTVDIVVSEPVKIRVKPAESK